MNEATSLDLSMMARCLEISRQAASSGEYPFAALISRGADIIAEVSNRAARDADVTRHAELVALSEAQKALLTKDLSNCTLYTNVEPCVMCSFPIRETRIAKVVFSIPSRLMGGISRWPVITDHSLSDQLPEYFGPVPVILPGLLRDEAEAIWQRWNPTLWQLFRTKGLFGGP